jgi:hypothetical protein
MMTSTDPTFEEVEETVASIIDRDDSILTTATEHGRRRRHEEIATTDPEHFDPERTAHTVRSETRKAVVDAILDAVTASDKLPAEPSPGTHDIIVAVCREYAENIMGDLVVGEQAVAEMVRDE